LTICNCIFRPSAFTVFGKWLSRAGLTAFAIGPSTLAQGQTLVAQAGGNTALALMLLVLTNVLAIITVPFLFKAILSTEVAAGSISLDSIQLLISLVITMLAPAVAGKACRGLPPRRRCVACLVMQ
jgi:predicted Na+-dependent transporter